MPNTYDITNMLNEAKRRLQSIKPRPAVGAPVRSILAPDNAAMMFGAGQMSEIYDVLNDDGTEKFILGVNAMDDTTLVE